jgi:uncharacterized protein (DUF1697 family)
MKTFVALLRGINVGGKNKIKMADLRSALGDAGFINVRTYIQSGNVVFESAKNQDSLELLISKTIKSQFGYEVPVMVREASFFIKAIKNCPYKNKDVAAICVAVLSEPAKKSDVKALESLDHGDDAVSIRGDVAYLYCPSGFSKTKLTNNFIEKKLRLRATSRNWRTLGKLIEMCADK